MSVRRTLAEVLRAIQILLKNQTFAPFYRIYRNPRLPYLVFRALDDARVGAEADDGRLGRLVAFCKVEMCIRTIHAGLTLDVALLHGFRMLDEESADHALRILQELPAKTAPSRRSLHYEIGRPVSDRGRESETNRRRQFRFNKALTPARRRGSDRRA